MKSSDSNGGNTKMGLTVGSAPFIEGAKNRNEMFIHQPYELYTEENHRAWRILYQRMQSRWEWYANEAFLKGLESLHLDPGRIPRLEDVNTFLKPLTGFQAKPVSGYIPAGIFFDCLRRREFPTTITIRDEDSLDYIREPDMFHDVCGHVPMHTSKEFADVLVRFGECARTGAERVILSSDLLENQRIHMQNIIKGMARFFWFTIEFGLMRGGHLKHQLRAYGSGLLSSFGELQYCIESPDVQRYPVQIEWLINQYFEIDHYQPLLFIVDSFDHLFSLVDELERWVKEGKLDNVAPGDPDVSDEDIKSFLEAIKK